MKLKNFIGWGLFIIIALRVQIQPVAADPVTFTIDPTQSIITLSGSLYISASEKTYPFTQQGAGSLTTSYTGSILADVRPPYILFPGGSLILANTNGTWKPAIGGGSGSAPADYGVEIVKAGVLTAYIADRNVTYDVISTIATLTNGDFNSDLMAFLNVTNIPPAPETDYSFTFPLEPSYDTSGSISPSGGVTNGPGTAYLTNSGGQLALFLPVNITYAITRTAYTMTFVRTGTLVATAPAGAWPLQASAAQQNGQVSLTWPSFPGPTFAVQTSPFLGAPWTTATGVTTVQANTTSWTGAATNTAQFYRVQATF